MRDRRHIAIKQSTLLYLGRVDYQIRERESETLKDSAGWGEWWGKERERGTLTTQKNPRPQPAGETERGEGKAERGGGGEGRRTIIEFSNGSQA